MDVVLASGLPRSQLLIQSFIPANLDVAKRRMPRRAHQPADAGRRPDRRSPSPTTTATLDLAAVARSPADFVAAAHRAEQLVVPYTLNDRPAVTRRRPRRRRRPDHRRPADGRRGARAAPGQAPDRQAAPRHRATGRGPRGRLLRAASRACKGIVTLRVLGAKRTLHTRQTKLARNCTLRGRASRCRAAPPRACRPRSASAATSGCCRASSARARRLSPQDCRPLLPPWQWRCRVLERDDVRGAVRIYGGRVKRRPRAVCDLFALPATPGSLTAAPDGTGGLAISFVRPATRRPPPHVPAGPGSYVVASRLGACPAAPEEGEAAVEGPWTVPDRGVQSTALRPPFPGRVCVAVWARDGVGRLQREAGDCGRRSALNAPAPATRAGSGRPADAAVRYASAGRGSGRTGARSGASVPAPASPRARGPSGATRASFGRYQFHLPSSFIVGRQQHAADQRGVDQDRRRQAHAELLHVDERERREDREHRRPSRSPPRSRRRPST